MDIALFDELQEDMPVYNQDILDGLAFSGLARAKELVDGIIRCAEHSYPPGFEFIRSEVCSPQEAFSVMSSSLTRSDRNAPTIDMAPSDVRLVKYLFKCDSGPLYARYFFLPYVRRGGLIKITAKQFSISPVLKDPGFSSGADFVFIRMSRAPVTFRRVITTVILDRDFSAQRPELTGEQKSKYVAYSWLHHRGGSNNKKSESDTISLGKVVTTLPHYLFCRYGMEETFRKFADCPVVVMTEQEIRDNPPDKDRYALLSSSWVRPSTLKTRIDYRLIQSPVVLVVPREKITPLVMSFAGAFFYILDHYPETVNAEDLLGDWRWKVWLGFVLWGDEQGHQKLVENVESHLTSLDAYVDIEVRNMLKEEEDLDVENIYELFVFMLQQMDDMIANKEEDIGTMYGKRAVTAEYVLRDIYEKIFLCLFEITNNKKRKHTADDYNKILGKFFMPTAIFDLRKTSTKAFMSSVSTPGDNMYVRITSRLVMQAQTSAGRKAQNINVNDPLSHLHASIAECGNYVVLPKNSPLGRNTLNATVKMDAKNTLLRKDSMREIVEHIDEAIYRP